MIEERKSICMFCSLGCGLIIRSRGGIPVELDYDSTNPINRGSLCPRGNYMMEYLNSSQRHTSPQIRREGKLEEVSFKTALEETIKKLKAIKKKYGPNSIGIIMNGECFNEEFYLGEVFAREIIKTRNFSVFHEDVISDSKEKVTPDDVSQSDVLLIIGDILTRSPVLSKNIVAVKYRKGTKVIVIDSKKTNTAWFATTHLQLLPGTEPLLLAAIIKIILEGKKGMKVWRERKAFQALDIKDLAAKTGVSVSAITEAAKSFDEAKIGTIILSTHVSREDNLISKLCNILVEISKGKYRFVSYYSSANSTGSLRAIKFKGKSLASLINAALGGEIKALIVFGVDLLRSIPEDAIKLLGKLKLLILAEPFPSLLGERASVIFPAISHMEGKGTVFSSGGKLQTLSKGAVGTPQARSYFEVLQELWGGFGAKFKTEILFKKFKKILRRKVVEEKIDLKQTLKGLKNLSAVSGVPKYPFVLIPDDDIVHIKDGFLTSKFYWATLNSTPLTAEINKADAAKENIKEFDDVYLVSKRGKLRVRVKLTDRLLTGTLTIPHHFKEVRELFEITYDESGNAIMIRPEAISLERV